MKRKRLNRDQWGFSHFPYDQIRLDNDDFHGTVCIIRITGGEYCYWEMPKAGRIAVCGEGMTWMELVPDGQDRVITVKYFRDGQHDPARKNYPASIHPQYQPSIWYVDVTEGVTADADGVLVYTDKYLDVIFSPEGDIKVDDRDELDEALASGDITEKQYQAALQECSAILKDLTEDIPATEAWCARIRAEVEKQLLEETKKGIRREENEFPKRFASFVEKDYGILYYMDDNHDSYDGNHAVIDPEKITDLGAVLDDIASFYRAKGIRCSIYHPFVKNYFRDRIDILQAHGYSYTEEKDHRVMILQAENSIPERHQLEIQALTEWDQRVATDILIPSGEPWEVDVTRERVSREGTILFVGYIDNRAVVYSDIHRSEYGNVRFDYIVTAKKHRGKRYASELLYYMAEYCKKRGFANCWQWAGPSEHICYKAGFREVFTMEAGWATGPEPAD